MGKSALLFNFIKAYAIDGIEDCLEEVISAAVGWGKREARKAGKARKARKGNILDLYLFQ